MKQNPVVTVLRLLILAAIIFGLVYFKQTQGYVSFKSGFFNVFGIQWMGTKTFAFFIKLDQKEAEKFPIKMTKYETAWKQAAYYIEPGKTKPEDFITIFEKAYKNFSG